MLQGKDGTNVPINQPQRNRNQSPSNHGQAWDTPKDIKEFLNIGSIQTVYNWCNGLSMPTVDNLYALSQFLQVPIDEIVCGNRKAIMPEPIVIIENSRTRRLYAYYKQLNRMLVA